MTNLETFEADGLHPLERNGSIDVDRIRKRRRKIKGKLKTRTA